MINLGATPLFNVTGGTAPIALFYVYCNGSELRLIDCYHYSSGWRCDHSDDVGVRCLATPGPGVWWYLWECQAMSCLITQNTIILYI